MKDVKKEDIIYSAGFFDGEGYIGVGYNKRLEIRIVNTNKKVLDYLQKLWGGHIYERKKSKKRLKIAFDWVLVAEEEVTGFVASVYPFLRVKKEQTDRAYSLLKILTR